MSSPTRKASASRLPPPLPIATESPSLIVTEPPLQIVPMAPPPIVAKTSPALSLLLVPIAPMTGAVASSPPPPSRATWSYRGCSSDNFTSSQGKIGAKRAVTHRLELRRA
jgi:hypothetical protein